MREAFRLFSQRCSEAVGAPVAFIFGIGLTVLWIATGSVFHYSDTWQLVMDTGTSVITFLMVFLIQNTQNRDMRVIQMKLDELLRAHQSARTELVQMENMSDSDLDRLHEEFTRHYEVARNKRKQA